MVVRQTLVFHASDTSVEADRLCDQLGTHQFPTTRLIKPDTGTFTLPTTLITDSAAIIVVASPRFFDSGFLINMTDVATFSRKFLPVLFSSYPGLVLPSWFTSATVIVLGESENLPKAFQHLVVSLINRAYS